jgi:hypothetical protein
MTNHDVDLDAIIALLAEAGYLIIRRRPDGGEAYQLTQTGARVARQLTMSPEVEQDALLEALLGAGRPDPPKG